jgi:hypothetical protein
MRSINVTKGLWQKAALIAFVGLALILAGCDTSLSPLSGGARLYDAANALALVDANGNYAGTVTTPLLAGQTTQAGLVSVAVVGDDLVVTYATSGGWGLEEVHLSVSSNGSIPKNKAGNPVIGTFAYSASNLAGATSHSLTIPLSSIPAFDGSELTIAAHAVVSRTLADGSVQTETGWASGPRINAKGSWATYFTVTIGDVDLDDDDDFVEVGTAYAFGGEFATSFFEADGTRRWGWTNGPLSAGSYEFLIYAGSGQSDLSKGTLIGTLGIEFDGSVATISYNADPGYFFTETHLYVGSENKPEKGFTANGHYGNQDSYGNPVTSDTYVIEGLSGEIFVIAHAAVVE